MGSSGSALKVCTDHRGGINWLSLSPDGQHLLTGSEDGTARLWSTADSQCHGHFQGHESYITFCHLENEVAFTCSADHTIRKWDVMTGQCLAIYRGHTSIVNRILVAKDYLFSGSYDRTARCWSVDKEKQIQEFRGHRNCVLTLAHYSPRDVLDESEEEQEKLSRDFLVTGSTDCTVKVWWVSSGRCYQTLLGHTGAVLCLILDAPNRELFSGSTDYTIRTWNIVTGEQLKVFKEHQGSVICLEVVKREQKPPASLCWRFLWHMRGGVWWEYSWDTQVRASVSASTECRGEVSLSNGASEQVGVLGSCAVKATPYNSFCK
ncbi:WD repeat-containing protein 86 isoform X4 [Trachemys scripta elegans]|uniref:WD repeat-containing protein 86 isoform X4 n=1 Tax=Trachemys scripta elegans TaxID=31138 RepID=UPI001552C990|nr:WD repeat-containing protein 86 isoform X4 [Trachemys scripta elegans]